jgi:methionyl-tRNA formyltransferase
MKIVFLGSGDFGLPTLRQLHAQHQVLAVVTQPDRPAGRHRQLTPTPIGQFAMEAGLPLHRHENVNEPAVVQQLTSLGAQAAVVIAFGQKLSAELVGGLAPLTVNLHASLLPRYRGAAPINWAIIQGESRTGNSVIGLAQRMDAGAVYAQAVTDIGRLETAGELEQRLSQMGPALIEQVLADANANRLTPMEQDHAQATRAPKLRKADGTVDFDAPAEGIRCRVHGLTPWPGVTVTWRSVKHNRDKPLLLRRVDADASARSDAEPGTVLEGHRVATRSGVIQLLEVQAPGGRPMLIGEFVRGNRIEPGDRLLPVLLA